MDIEDYQIDAMRTNAVSDGTAMLHLALMGLLGELGEIAEPIKKYLYSAHSLDIAHLQGERSRGAFNRRIAEKSTAYFPHLHSMYLFVEFFLWFF
ncbi:MAG: hypothetical protein J2P36_33955 [Ktedonobacteraceae bacterium]|nr:hypothetical protein [Ktedonobacteraceae bacterium]